MSLAAGTRLGPYVIEAPLGAGGMGEVYKARDTKLDRDVAIKVLPAHLASDATARARFEREARAVAALSHPNILAIYDFGVETSVAYAVMELLAGETLRDRLAAGRLGLRKLGQIGGDIAHGLAAAHDKGIVHRDVKPENVFITADGHVKILDFGLARQAPVVATGATVAAPTMAANTDAGTVMGTVGYMSPEQVRGQAADHRSDIFSLGCVLYEMASGRRAFERGTAAETMTAILREEPVEPAGEPGAMPPALDHVVRHCLEKRPEERFQSARDLAFALQSLSEPVKSGGQPAAARAPSGSWRPIAVGIALAAGVALFLAGRYTANRAEGESQVASFAQVTDLAGVEANPSLSPDGKSVVYAKPIGAGSALFLLRIGARNPVRLSTAAPGNDVQPAFSPDGERIAFRSDRDGGGIFLMSASGESVTRLTDFGFSPSWSPDGGQIVVSVIAFIDPTSLMGSDIGLTIVNVRTGDKRALTTGRRSLQPSWSPGGARVAYWGIKAQTGQRDIWTVAADGSDAAAGGVPVTDDAALDWSPTWSPDGQYLYYSSTRGGTMNLWRVRIAERSGRLLGEPEPITTPSTWSGELTFSRDGSNLAFASLDYRSTLVRAPFDAERGAITGSAEPILKGTRPIRDHELSPDGAWIAFTSAGVREDLFVARADGTEYRRLTDDAFRDRGPAWSPDGARIAFYSDRGGTYDLWTIRPDGSGLTAITEGSGTAGFPTWSPDGSRLAFGFDAWHVVEATANATRNLASGPRISATERFMPASWSPTGERIAGQIRVASGAVSGLTVYALDTKTFTAVPGDLGHAPGWLFPVWLADGRRLLVRRPDGIAVVDAATGEGRLILSVGGFMIGHSVGVSRDNRWITYTETATEGDIWVATLRK